MVWSKPAAWVPLPDSVSLPDRQSSLDQAPSEGRLQAQMADVSCSV